MPFLVMWGLMRDEMNETLTLFGQVVGGGSEEIIADLAIRQETALARKKGWKL